MKRITVRELGDKLPVGVETAPGARSRRLSFRPWRQREEREIGRIKESNPEMTQHAFAARVLAIFLRELGGHDFDSLKEGERLLVIYQAFAADVYHAWIQLRRTALGDSFPVPITCAKPTCKKSFVYEVDLGTVDVDVVDDGAELTDAVGLRDGITWQGKTRKIVTFGQIRWGAYERIGSANEGEIKAAVIAGGIVGLDGVSGPVQVTPDLLDDELTKHDFEVLSRAISEGQAGPSFMIEPECPKCGTVNRRAIPWIYNDFFSLGASLRSASPESSEKSGSSSSTTSPGSPQS